MNANRTEALVESPLIPIRSSSLTDWATSIRGLCICSILVAIYAIAIRDLAALQDRQVWYYLTSGGQWTATVVRYAAIVWLAIADFRWSRIGVACILVTPGLVLDWWNASLRWDTLVAEPIVFVFAWSTCAITGARVVRDRPSGIRFLVVRYSVFAATLYAGCLCLGTRWAESLVEGAYLIVPCIYFALVFVSAWYLVSRRAAAVLCMLAPFVGYLFLGTLSIALEAPELLVSEGHVTTLHLLIEGLQVVAAASIVGVAAALHGDCVHPHRRFAGLSIRRLVRPLPVCTLIAAIVIAVLGPKFNVELHRSIGCGTFRCNTVLFEGSSGTINETPTTIVFDLNCDFKGNAFELEAFRKNLIGDRKAFERALAAKLRSQSRTLTVNIVLSPNRFRQTIRDLLPVQVQRIQLPRYRVANSG